MQARTSLCRRGARRQAEYDEGISSPLNMCYSSISLGYLYRVQNLSGIVCPTQDQQDTSLPKHFDQTAMTLDTDTNISSTQGTRAPQSQGTIVSVDQSWVLNDEYKDKQNRWQEGKQHYRHTSMTTMLNHLKSPIQGNRKAEEAATDFYHHLSRAVQPNCGRQHYLDSHYSAADAFGKIVRGKIYPYVDNKTKTEMRDDLDAATFFAFSQIVTEGERDWVLPENTATKESSNVYFEVSSQVSPAVFSLPTCAN